MHFSPYALLLRES